MSGRNAPLYCTITLINSHAGTLTKADIKYDEPGYSTILLHLDLGSNGWVSALQAEVLAVKWRGKNESTMMLMVFEEVLTGRG